MSNLNNKKIKICILEMSSQNKAILEFFFDNSGKLLFEESSLEKAQAYIIDYDFPNAKESAEKIYSSSKMPGIIISIKEVDLPDTVWISKPLTISALSSANEKISDIISLLSEQEEKNVEVIAPTLSVTSSTTPPVHNTIVEELVSTPVKEDLLLDPNSLENNFNNGLENIQTPEMTTTENIQAEKDSTLNSHTIKTTAPAFTGFEESADILETTFDNSQVQKHEINIEPQFTQTSEPEVIAPTSPVTSSTTPPVRNTIAEEQVSTPVKEDLLLNSISLEDDFNNGLENIQSPEVVTTENIQAKKDSTLNSHTIETKAPAFAGFEESADVLDTTFDNSQVQKNELNIEPQFTQTSEPEVIAPTSPVTSSTTPPAHNTIVEEQVSTAVKENLLLDSISLENDFNNGLENIQSPEAVTTENIQAKKDGTLNSHTIENTTPAFAGFKESADILETTFDNSQVQKNEINIDPQIIQTTEPEVIDTPSVNTHDEIDDLLNQLITSDVESFVNNNSSTFESLEENTSNNTNSELEPSPFENEVIENPKGILDQVNEQLSNDIITDLNSNTENHLELGTSAADTLDTNILNTESNITVTESEIIDSSFENNLENISDNTSKNHEANKEFNGTSIKSLEENIADLANIETSSSVDSINDSLDNSSDKPYLESVIDDAINDLPTDKDYALEPELSANTDTSEHINEVVTAPKQVQPASNTEKREEQARLLAEEELQSLLEEVRHEAEDRSSTIIRTNNGKSTKSQYHTPTFAEERWSLTCGESNPVSNKQTTYNPNDYMLMTLLKVINQSKSTEKVMRLKFNNIIIVVLPDLQTIYCDMSIYKNSYANICFNPISAENIKIHYLDNSEIRLYKNIINKEVELAHSFEAFIWTTSLLTARGRLPEGTDIKKRVALKYWPDLTRIETIPHVMQIAAVFYKHPGSLRDLPTWLGIEQRYIFSFYNAALSLKLIELDHKQVSLVARKNKTLKKTKNRGFFSRLLKRINS